MSKYEIVYLSQKDVLDCGILNMAQVIEDLERTFILHTKKDFVMPPKSVLRWGDKDSEETIGRINAMPAYVGGDVNMIGIKWIGSSPHNPQKYGLPRASALVVLNDSETKLPLAIMDGTIISAMRTGGVTGVAAKYCARANSTVAGIIGAGVQNRTQLMALKEVLPQLSTVKVFDINMDRSSVFANEVGQMLNLNIYPVMNAQEAVEDADIIVTATTALEPIVKEQWIKKGCFYSHVGAHEAEFGVLKKADKIIVDDWFQIKHKGTPTAAIMYEQGLLSDNDIYAELGEIVSKYKFGRENEEEFIYFSSIGLAIDDIPIAKRMYENAKLGHIGTNLELWEKPFWV